MNAPALRPFLSKFLWLRHVFGYASCVWLVVGASATALAQSARVVITPAAGFSIGWDGNNGEFSTPESGAAPSNNVALASQGTVPFSSSDLGPLLGITFHVAANLNDGLYGNSFSWISANGVGGTSDLDPFAGLNFNGLVSITNIAWGRDNGDAVGDACGGTCTDRTIGVYTLQYTQVAAPDATTPQTDDAATGWVTIGTIEYLPGTEDANFTSYLRHRFEVAEGGMAIAATGLRIKVPDGSIAIDEIEVNPIPSPIPPITNFIELTAAPGFAIAWDGNEGNFGSPNTPAPAPANDASASNGATAFGSSQLDFGVHFIANVNDGLYGNAHSWIPDFSAMPDPMPFIGINFGRRILLSSVAWGRDNGDVAGDCCGGTLTDRGLGVYVLQVTTVPDPSALTPEACGPSAEGGWITVATINYKADNPTYFNSYLRHRFDVTQGGSPIPATGIRIFAPANTTAIDEIEVNPNQAIEQNAVQIAGAAGFSILWDGNDGHFNDPAEVASPPSNRALASEGTTPFSSSDLGPELGISFHVAANLNDGRYGNSHSWISANGVGGTSDLDPFAGLNFGGLVAITNIAWGRDNGNTASDACGGTCPDRNLGTYRLQFTQVATPDATTPDTGDAATGWADIGTVSYTGAAPPFFTPHLRHRFDVAETGGPINATGLRIKVPDGSIAIDEIEINTPAEAPAPPGPVGIEPAFGFEIVWDGNDGDFFDPAVGAPPLNRGLATEGTTPFTSSDLGPILGISFHVAANLNDGLYGNSFSWISANGVGGTTDPDPFAGLNFNGVVELSNIAWSRDNGASQVADRTLGLYTLQVTTVPSPDATTVDTGDSATGWQTIGMVDYRRNAPPDFNSHRRHRFDLSTFGAPIEATGVRIKVPNGSIAIDEIEINTATERPLPRVAIELVGEDAVITWTGGGGLECSEEAEGEYACVPEAASPYIVPLNSGPMRFYRVRR